MYLELPGISMVVLNSYEVAQELLGKRTNTTSGRKIHDGGGEVGSALSLGRPGEYIKANRILMYSK